MGAKSKRKQKLVVLTGGPGAGKTAILDLARRTFGTQIVVLPEVATILYGGGFCRKETTSGREAAQRAIFHVQKELEYLLLSEKGARLVLCDRGSLDGLAYWPGTEARFLKELRTSRTAELARYDAIIHLHTPVASQGYDLSNPCRTETPAQASALDKKIVRCWRGHPQRHFVERTDDFMEKAQKALELIQATVPFLS